MKVAYETLAKIIPPDDYECFEAAKLANDYCIHWKQEKCIGILLCESHANTSRDLVFDGPRLSEEYLPQYDGPRNYVSHVNNFVYGENESGSARVDNNKGSTQFWRLLGSADPSKVIAHGREGTQHAPIARWLSYTEVGPR